MNRHTPSRRRALRHALAALAIASAAPLAFAQSTGAPLRIGMAGAVTSMDPHYYNATPNNTIALHVFEPLIAQDANGKPIPALATSWKAVSDTVWEFKLRDGVKWHDGSAFTGKDVAFSLERVKNVPGAPGGFASMVNAIKSVEVVDPLTVRVTTAQPAPNTPIFMTFLAIVSEQHGRNAATGDYNSGKAMVGTGPYKFSKYVAGDTVELVRNDQWWGAKPEWARVEFKMVPNLAVRTTALLSGDLDVIEAPSATDLPRLKADPKVAIYSTRSIRVAYINPVVKPSDEADPVTDASGKKIEPTPLQNAKVRHALSLAINRKAIVDRVMLGTAEATGQIMPSGTFGYSPDFKIPPYDPAAARKLLTEAGYPKGFNITMTAANDRTPYNVEVAQAIAQMWSRIGVNTKVNGVPTSVYARLGGALKLPVYLGSWGNTSMEPGVTMTQLLHTVDKAASKGSYNWSGYSNTKFDELVDSGMAKVDPKEREQTLQEATRVVLDDAGVIPIFHFLSFWAARNTIVVEPRADGMTLAYAMKSKGAKR
jgi:peptide/nickel transport system substrate-binding protein